jgi:hypothetical protein
LFDLPTIIRDHGVCHATFSLQRGGEPFDWYQWTECELHPDHVGPHGSYDYDGMNIAFSWNDGDERASVHGSDMACRTEPSPWPVWVFREEAASA